MLMACSGWMVLCHGAGAQSKAGQAEGRAGKTGVAKNCWMMTPSLFSSRPPPRPSLHPCQQFFILSLTFAFALTATQASNQDATPQGPGLTRPSLPTEDHSSTPSPPTANDTALLRLPVMISGHPLDLEWTPQNDLWAGGDARLLLSAY